MNLKEYLEEGIGPRTLYHFTDAQGLLGILQSNVLLGQGYGSTTKHGKDDICLVRPSMAHKKNMEKLSSSSNGGVKLIIDASKLSDKVRGVKIRPVAEFPTVFLSFVRRITGFSTDKKIYKVAKGVAEYHKKKMEISKIKKGKKKEDYSKELQELHNEYYNRLKIHPSQLYDLSNKYVQLIASKNREGEERISVREGDAVPINESYVKIEIMDARKVFKETYADERNDLLKAIRKNSKFFVRNDELKKLLEYIKAISAVNSSPPHIAKS